MFSVIFAKNKMKAKITEIVYPRINCRKERQRFFKYAKVKSTFNGNREILPV